jgi:hypothetical protein
MHIISIPQTTFLHFSSSLFEFPAKTNHYKLNLLVNYFTILDGMILPNKIKLLE